MFCLHHSNGMECSLTKTYGITSLNGNNYVFYAAAATKCINLPDLHCN
jgi:hypothetical protein